MYRRKPMGKLIAVWGAPGSGKTTFSVKLAEALYRSRGKAGCSVIVVFTDSVAPALPVVFPGYKPEDIFSVGSILSKPDITPNDAVAGIVTVKDRMNLGFLGYRLGENKYSFPAYTEEKAKTLFTVLCGVSDYVIADCMSDPTANCLTSSALSLADSTVRISSPDLRCMSYCSSQLSLFAAGGYLHDDDIQVMNVPGAEYTNSAPDMSAALGLKAYILPYSPMLLEQSLAGVLYEPLKDKRYMQTVQKIAERLV